MEDAARSVKLKSPKKQALYRAKIIQNLHLTQACFVVCFWVDELPNFVLIT